jgi:hypothetical protein
MIPAFAFTRTITGISLGNPFRLCVTSCSAREIDSFARGTGGSNPLPSSEESIADLILGTTMGDAGRIARNRLLCRQAPRERPRRSLCLKLVHGSSSVVCTGFGPSLWSRYKYLIWTDDTCFVRSFTRVFWRTRIQIVPGKRGLQDRLLGARSLIAASNCVAHQPNFLTSSEQFRGSCRDRARRRGSRRSIGAPRRLGWPR